MNVYEIVTERIIKRLEAGVIPWRRPWNALTGMPVSWTTKKPYRGINCLLLEPGEYLTFHQVQECGGKIKKGEKANIAVFYKPVPADEEKGREAYSVMRYYNLFEVSQCEGINRKMKEDIDRHDNVGIPEAERVVQEYFSRTGSPVLEIGNTDMERAYYSPQNDTVHIPDISLYKTQEEYYSTAFHEMTHSTAAENRLRRDMNCNPFSSAYAKEELIAELGAAMLCAECRINNSTVENSAGYIQSWLKHLSNDKRLIVTASAAAQRAADFIKNRSEGALVL